jgi:hypothetical protein
MTEEISPKSLMRGILMATATKRTAKKAAPKTPPPVETEELEDDDDLEELEEDDVEEVAPKKATAKKSTTQTVTFGVSDLAKLLVSQGHKVDARGLRTLIRKMARDGSNRVNREIIAGNRTRYDWSGPNDPEVKKIIKAFLGGELEADKQEKLAALKANKAAKDAKKVKGTKKKAKVEVVEDDDDDEELEDDE